MSARVDTFCGDLRERLNAIDWRIKANPSAKAPLRLVALAGVALVLSLAPAAAATLTHTTSNLNLRAGPGKHYAVKTIIPAGAEIDVHSCGHTWCYTSWTERQGYVSRDYLIHHVTVEVYPIVHVTNVHYHSIF